MPKVFVLEDDETRINQFKKRFEAFGWDADFECESEKAIYRLKHNTYDLIFLDHDLGGQTYVDTRFSNTGSEVARWMHENNIETRTIIHSFNPAGAENMHLLLKNSIKIPSIWNKDIFYEVFGGNS